MHFRHISAKIQPKNWKQHFDWGGGRACDLKLDCITYLCTGIGGSHRRRSPERPPPPLGIYSSKSEIIRALNLSI